MNTKQAIKKRYWSFILYPESAPDNWVDVLKVTGLPCAISPLHDLDLWSENDEKLNSDHKAGTVKKPHHHVLMAFSGPTTFNSVNAICSKLNCPEPTAIESVKGYYDYLSHKNEDDNLKKHYDENDIVLLNGFRIENFIELTSDEVLAIKKRIHHIIIDENILEYSDLCEYLLSHDFDIEYKIASTSTIHFGKLIDSRRRKLYGGK